MKLTDFGIAQALDDPRLTTSGTLVGSPAYMDPERISQSAVTPASDLWSLGATMFHAVEGYPPFQRETTAATMHAIMTEKPRLRQCTGPLATIISGLLMAAPDARLNTTGVRGLLTAATATLPGESARPAGTPQADGTTVHRDGGFPGATRVTERPRRRWRGRLLLLTAFLLVAALGAVGGFFLGPILTGHSLTSRYLTYGPGGQIPKFDVSSSSPACLSGQLAERRSFSSSSGPSCDEPHDAEVFWSSTDINSSSEDVGYPAWPAWRTTPTGLCGMLFGSRLVPAVDKAASLTYTSLVPTEQAYRDARAHSSFPPIYCVLSRKDGQQMQRSMVADQN